jgi:preprotein translocase subunit SecF
MRIWFTVSVVLVAAGLFSIFFFGYHKGVDFAGGALMEVSVSGTKVAGSPENLIQQSYKQAVNMDVAAQSSGADRFIIRSLPMTNDQKQAVLDALGKDFNQVNELRFQTVSPTISSDTTRRAILAVIVAILGILFYISLSFRRVPKPASSFRFALAAIAALVHDMVILLGAYALMSHFLGAEMDSLFMTALLTLLGFSVHDTIVTFDRIRENLRRRTAEQTFDEVANRSILETLTRSINTSYTLVLVILSVLFFGGSTLKFFSAALLIGVIFGTYSSIFVAAQILVWWQGRIERRSTAM